MRKILLLIGIAITSYAQFPEKPPESPPSYVGCIISGQLGNQLFQLSTALVTAWEYGAIPVFSELQRTDFNVPICRKKIFFRLNDSPPPDIQWNHFHLWGFDGNTKVYYQPIHYQPNLFIDGWNWQTSYFDKYKNRLIEIYAPSDEEEAEIQEKYGELLKIPNVVAVHIRASHPDYHWFFGLNYVKDAINLFPEDSTFVVFSDRICWAKKKLSGYKKNMVFIEGNDHVRDFFLMNKCKHHIISNSTYSFWAAYLKNDPEQIVIAPDLYHRVFDRFSAENGAYPKNWTVLKVTQEDIRLYQDIANYPTTSVHGG